MSLTTLLNAAFESNSEGSKVYSILAKNMSKPTTSLNETDSSSELELYNFLSNYNFVTYLLNIIQSTLSDVFNKSSMRVTIITGDNNIDEGTRTNLSKECNKFLDDLTIFDVIRTDLIDILYKGNYGYYVDFKNTRIQRIKGSFNILTEDSYCKDKRLVIENWKDEDEKDSSYALIPIQYNPIKYSEVTELEAYTSSLGSTANKPLIDQYLLDHPNSDKKIQYTLYRGKGVLDSVMYPILMLYMKELLYDLLGLKDTMRPDILMARITDDKTDESKIAEAMNDIEALVNQGSASSTEPGFTSFVSVANLLSGIQSYLMNGIKVVPEVTNFSSISNLEIPSLLGKRSALKSEIQELRERVFNQLGIDEAASTNKWESMQRNSKYLTLIENLVDMIVSFIRTLIYEYLNEKYPELKLSLSNIELDMDTTNIIFNQYATTRSRVLTDKIDVIGRLIRTISDWKDSSIINPDALNEYIGKLIMDLDPTAINLFNANASAVHPRKEM